MSVLFENVKNKTIPELIKYKNSIQVEHGNPWSGNHYRSMNPETEANMNGVEYKRTGKGSDYEETHHDALTGKKTKQLVEVKSDDA